jgi:hypothetical protein
VGKVLEDGDSRRKVLGLAERLLAIADRAERHPEVADQLEALATGEDAEQDMDEAALAAELDADEGEAD